MTTRVEVQQLLIAMRRTKLAEHMICSRCGQSIGPLPPGAEHDEFYTRNQDFWLELASCRHAPKCQQCSS